jgi:hypothetical protein
LIHGGGRANGVGDLFAGYEAGGNALAKAGAFGDGAQPPALGQGYKCCPQHGAPDFRGLGLPKAFIISYLALQYFLPQTGGSCSAWLLQCRRVV